VERRFSAAMTSPLEPVILSEESAYRCGFAAEGPCVSLRTRHPLPSRCKPGAPSKLASFGGLKWVEPDAPVILSERSESKAPYHPRAPVMLSEERGGCSAFAVEAPCVCAERQPFRSPPSSHLLLSSRGARQRDVGPAVPPPPCHPERAQRVEGPLPSPRRHPGSILQTRPCRRPTSLSTRPSSWRHQPSRPKAEEASQRDASAS
jgi:hypothetical protein